MEWVRGKLYRAHTLISARSWWDGLEKRLSFIMKGWCHPINWRAKPQKGRVMAARLETFMKQLSPKVNSEFCNCRICHGFQSSLQNWTQYVEISVRCRWIHLHVVFIPAAGPYVQCRFSFYVHITKQTPHLILTEYVHDVTCRRAKHGIEWHM